MAESERSKVSLRSASEKRSRGSPTGCTPLQKGKRSTTELKEVGESQQTGSHHCQPRRRRLAFAKTDAWSDSEQIALVEFILLHKPGRRWPAEQDPRFWDSAAEYMYVAMRSNYLGLGKVREGHVARARTRPIISVEYSRRYFN